MPLDVFSAGTFVAWPQLAEWDGSNHEEILDWISGLDVWTTDPALAWTIASVTESHLVLHKAPDLYWSDGQDVVVELGGWISAVKPTNADMLMVQRVDPAGKWRAADRYGRPEQLEDMLAAGGGAATETLRPNGNGDVNQHSVSGASTAAAAVADDSDSTYLRNNTGSKLEDRFQLAAPTQIPIDATIDSIDVRFRARTEASSGGAVTVGVRVGSSSSMADSQTAVPTAATDYARTGIARPGGGSWTAADLADLQVVVTSNDGSADAMRVFGLWVDVHYREAAA